MANNEYNQWLADTKAEEAKAKKEVAYMADFLKTCFNIDTTMQNPDIDIRTTPINQWYTEAVDQTADQLDSLYYALDNMMDSIKRMQKAVEELSDIRRELATTTPEDFED
jgi:hypothetical protein